MADAVHLPNSILARQYELILDQARFHMLVVDADARQYLQNVHALLRPEGHFVMLNQAWREGDYEGDIHSVEEYKRVFQHDLARPKEWEAWDGRQWRKVLLPSFPSRPRCKGDYLRELERAGFRVDPDLPDSFSTWRHGDCVESFVDPVLRRFPAIVTG